MSGAPHPEDQLYWQSPDEDEAMQDEHAFVWRAMLNTIDVGLAGNRVLDAGCNRGGFLRLLCRECQIASGHGYDPAPGAIADARRLGGQCPLTFEVADTVPAGWADFDVAFSHEVLYLLRDLQTHAAGIHGALRPGGVYFAVMGVHAGAPTMAEWHGRNARRFELPRLYTLDEVIATFTAAGFEAAVARLKVGFIPVSDHAQSFPADMEYFYEHKVMLRFAKPAAG